MNTQIVGIAWFRSGQWERLREVSADRIQLETNYDDWVRHAEKTLFDLHTNGLKVVRVDIDVDDLLSWCKIKHFPINSESRSKYAAEMLQLRDQQSGNAT
jgi:hypothetical protein